MHDPLLFWTIVSAIGQAAGAIATAAAVIVSLWIVVSERKPKLNVHAALMLVVAGDGTPATDIISIRISNTGLRKVRCVSLGWKTGYLKRGPAFLRRQMAMQIPAYVPGSPQFPLDLDPGEEASILQEIEAYRDALDEGTRRELFCRTLPVSGRVVQTRVQVIVSLAAHNGVFAPVDPGLRHFLATGTIKDGAAKFNERAGIG